MKIELENFKVEKSMFQKLKSGNPVQRDEVSISIFVCLFIYVTFCFLVVKHANEYEIRNKN